MFKNSAKNLLSLSKREVFEWLNSFDAVLTDCDGVLWHDDKPISGSPETVNALKSAGKQVYFVTNNSTKTRYEIWQRAVKMNFNITEANIIAPTHSVVEYLKNLRFNDKVYVIGGTGMTDELDAANIAHFGSGPDILFKMDEYIERELLPHYIDNVGAVVVGFDEHFNFAKLMKATHYLTTNPYCILLSTNSDPVHKYPNYNIPGTGAIVKSVETCVQRKALLMGKPSPVVCENLVKKGMLVPERTLMIGDSSKIDVVFGKNCGFQTLLVDNSNHPQTEISEILANPEKHKDCLPDVYLPKLSDMLPYLTYV